MLICIYLHWTFGDFQFITEECKIIKHTHISANNLQYIPRYCSFALGCFISEIPDVL